MAKMKFKIDKVHCEVCKKEFTTNKYIIKSPMEMLNGRSVPKRQLPDHKCKGKK